MVTRVRNKLGSGVNRFRDGLMTLVVTGRGSKRALSLTQLRDRSRATFEEATRTSHLGSTKTHSIRLCGGPNSAGAVQAQAIRRPRPIKILQGFLFPVQ